MAKILFLDDSLKRCADFSQRHPTARIVHTVEDCITALQESGVWDQVHLDHDLGGETYCNTERDDTGSEVARWLYTMSHALPQPYRVGEVIVHTKNEFGALSMVLMLYAAGYNVCWRPFRYSPETPDSEKEDHDIPAQRAGACRTGDDKAT